MKILQPEVDIKKIDLYVKNRWRWSWILERDCYDRPLKGWCKKIDKAGLAFCELCNKTINYGSNGKRALHKHSKDPDHSRAYKAQLLTQTLPGATAKLAPESLLDRIADLKAVTAGFISENCLAFSMGPKLIEFAQRLSMDKGALAKLSMSRTALTYTNTHGLAKAFREDLSEDLAGNYFSINVDEATNNAMDKLINVMVQYYDDKQGKVVIDHLGARKENIATSENITLALDKILGDLTWKQVITCLMDNCNVMRGVKNGVEARIRNHRNRHLLDISGDTVHMVNNAAKSLFSSFGQYVENFCSDIFYDIEQSPKQKELLAEMQTLLSYSKVKSLVRPISSRFLQMLDVTSRVCELMDCLKVYYYSFLPISDKVAFENDLGICLKKHLVNQETRARITEIQGHLSKQAKSDCNHSRKGRITKALFLDFPKLKCHLNLYRGLLPQFTTFIKKFQAEKPMIHILLAEIYQVTVEFFSNFIRPQSIPDEISGLVGFDPTAKAIQLSNRNLNVGPCCYADINKARIGKLDWVEEFYKSLREGYNKAGKMLVSKLPLNHKSLANLSALDPCMRKEAGTLKAFEDLAIALPNVIDPGELGHLQSEVRSYTVDHVIKENAFFQIYQSKKMKGEDRIDIDWWTKVFQIKNPISKEAQYPLLSKLVKALLSIICGPIVESSFNIMDDIIESDRASMTVENYEGLSRVKYGLKKRGVKAINLKSDARIRMSCHTAYKAYKDFLKNKRLEKEQKQTEKLKNSLKLLTLKKANNLATKKRTQPLQLPKLHAKKSRARNQPYVKPKEQTVQKSKKRPASIFEISKPVKGFKIPKLSK